MGEGPTHAGKTFCDENDWGSISTRPCQIFSTFKFASATYLPKIASLPFLQIHSTGDEYTNVAAAKKLFSAAQEPKRFSLVQAQDHRFSGGRPEFFRGLREGLDWMKTASH